MNQDFSRNWASWMDQMQKPFRAFMELNMNALQNISYPNLMELENWHPSKFLENQMKIMMQNSQQAMEYMRRSFQIWNASFSESSRVAEPSFNGATKTRVIKNNLPLEKKNKTKGKKSSKTLLAKKKSSLLGDSAFPEGEIAKSAAELATPVNKITLPQSKKSPLTSNPADIFNTPKDRAFPKK